MAWTSIIETVRRLAPAGGKSDGESCLGDSGLVTVFVLTVLLLLVVLILAGVWWFAWSANTLEQPGVEVLPLGQG